MENPNTETQGKTKNPMDNQQEKQTRITKSNDRLKSNCMVVHCHSLPAVSTMLRSIFGP